MIILNGPKIDYIIEFYSESLFIKMDTRPKRIIEAERKFMAAIVEKGWTLLTPYVDGRTHVLIQCQNLHQFPRAPRHIADTKGCTECPSPAYIEARENFYRRVAEQNGTVIGEYAGAKVKVEIRCHKGHVFKEFPSTITYTVCWCKTCEKIAGITTEDKVMGTIDFRDGELISPYS